MKKNFILFGLFTLLLFCQNTFAQRYINILEAPKDIPLKNGKVTYQGIIEIPGASMKELYGFAKKFIAETYKSSEAVIDMDDTLNGVVVVKASSAVLREWLENKNGKVLRYNDVAFTKYQLIIEVKDEKLRFTMNDFVLRTTSELIRLSVPDINNEVEGYIVKSDQFDPTKEYKNSELASFNFTRSFLVGFHSHFTTYSKAFELYLKNQKSEDW